MHPGHDVKLPLPVNAVTIPDNFIFPQEKPTILVPNSSLFLLFHTLPSLRCFTKSVLSIHIINYNMNKQTSYSGLSYFTYKKYLFTFGFFYIIYLPKHNILSGIPIYHNF